MDIIFGVFIWDSEKELDNVCKHGVDFTTAIQVFNDRNRRIFFDLKHSLVEPRLFAVGLVEERVTTVRFTYREDKIRIFGAGYWRKGRRYYEKKKSV